MKCEYRQLGTLVDRKIGYGIIQPGPNQKQGVPIIKVNNIISGLKSTTDLECTTEQISSKYERTKLRGGEVIISVVGTIGKTAIVPKTFAGCNLVRATAMIDIPDLQLAKWVKYYLDSPSGQAYIHQNLNTTVQLTLNIKSLSEMPIPFYSDTQMQQVISVLESLDDKIELNNKINENLQQQAQALYQNLFIDNADSEWQQGHLSDLITVRYGKDHKKLSDGIYPVFGSGGLMRKVERPLYDKESVLIPRKGTLNNVIYINEPFWTVDTMFYTEMKQPNVAKFVYHFVKSKDLAFMNAGSAVPSMTTDILNALELPIPSSDVLATFENIVSPMYSAMQHNARVSTKLTELRDSLLPKLMFGEIDVEDVKI